jgi:hypothetical protein
MFSFGISFPADLAELVGFNSKDFANLIRRKHYNAFHLGEIRKKRDCLISGYARVPFPRA